MQLRFSPLALMAFMIFTPNLAWSTSPIGNPLNRVWKETSEGETVYAQRDDERLLSLCIEFKGVGNWLPKELLSDISHPKLEEINFWQGMGLEGIEDHVPNWGNWGLSLEVESEIEVEGKFEDGPTYYFVLDEQNNVVFRMARSWVATGDLAGSKQSRAEWLAINPEAIRRAACFPTQ
jgi:hypothetical protein